MKYLVEIPNEYLKKFPYEFTREIFKWTHKRMPLEIS